MNEMECNEILMMDVYVVLCVWIGLRQEMRRICETNEEMKVLQKAMKDVRIEKVSYAGGMIAWIGGMIMYSSGALNEDNVSLRQ